MEVKLCPYCMQTTFGDFCKNCKRKVDYQEKPMQLPVGTELQGYHHYIVGAALGQGGFGVTYLALDTDSNRRVALKEFYPVHCSGRTKDTTVMAFDGQDEDFEKGKQRFLLEAQTMQRLARVQSVVEVYDCFQANNTVYLVMEYVEGQSLKKFLEENGPVEPQKFFAMMRPLLEDIALMHRQGVIHRDIAPDNIILDTDGKLRLIDFGTAREYMGQASMTVVVKKGFAPVEQYTRRGQSAATDVYALAATMYYCITGHVVPDSMDRIEEDMLKRPSEWGVKLPQNQEDALIHALGVRVKDRTQTVDAFLAELLPEPPKPKPVPKPEPKPEPKQEPKPEPKQEPIPIAEDDSAKKKKPIWIGIAAVLLAVVGIVVAVSGGKETVGIQYAYSDDPADNAMYTAEEFAEIVNSENVRDLLPLGTKIKMVPNSWEMTYKSIEFELVAYKHFRLADGEDFAKTTWLAVNLLNETREMNADSTNKGGWPESELRQWLNETLYPSLPEYWKGLMQEVQVCSTAGNGSMEIVSSNDYLFIPSCGEVDANYAIQDRYSGEVDEAAEERTFSIFTDDASRVKACMGDDRRWWLRSPWAGSSNTFDYVNNGGGSGAASANTSSGVCLGFCLGGGAAGVTAVDEVTMKVWVPMEDQMDANGWLQQMEAKFEAAHPEYKMTWVNEVCGDNAVKDQVGENPAAAADVYMFANDQLGDLIAANGIAKLDGSYLEQVQNDNGAAMVDSVTAPDGSVYGFPVAANTWFLYYNKDVYAEEDVQSLETMLEKGVVAFPTKNSWYLGSFFFANGATTFGPNGNNAADGVQFGTDNGMASLKAVLKMVNHPNYRTDDAGLGNSGLKSGEVAAYFSGSWEYEGLKEALGDKLGAAQLPTVMIDGEAKTMKSFAIAEAVAVNPNSANMKAAMQFASFLASAEGQLLRYEIRSAIPVATSLTNDPAIASDVLASAVLNSVANTTISQPTIAEMGNWWGPMETLGNNIIGGYINANNGAGYLTETLNSINYGNW